MFSRDERYVVVFNGEIFNYIELRDELKSLGLRFNTNTDTEVLLASYQQWGETCLNRFNGMWAFVIYDRWEKKIFASRDRYGIKPFYYYKNDRFFAFASEMPPLLSLLPGKPTPDNQSIFDYLVFNRTDQTQSTFFNEIKKLQHGHAVKLDFNTENGFSNSAIEKWYDLKARVAESKGFTGPEEFRDLFSSAVGLRLRSDVPVGVCLSGGLDSSSIVSVLLDDFQKKDLHTFSAVYKKGQYGDETEFIDEYRPLLENMYFTTPDAQTLERDLNTFIQAHAEPIPSTSPYAQFKVMKLAKNHVVVTLDGQGADEELAGYHYFFGNFFKDLLVTGRWGSLSRELFFYLSKHRSLYGLKTFVYFLLPKKIRASLRTSEKGYISPDFVQAHQEKNTIAGDLYEAASLNEALLNHFEYKLEHLLKWEDRNSMWFSLEARVPFLDYRLVERILATQSNWIIRNGDTKYILREAMKSILPAKIQARRDKTGFDTPQDEWFRTRQWQEIINDILLSSRFRRRNIIDADMAVKKYKQHLEGKVNISKEIWKWVHLELWFRRFID
jgi:asparagine synthase (glutamine-hydrolysing)